MRYVRLLRVAFVYVAYAVIILTAVYGVVPVVAWWRSVGDDYDLVMQQALHRAARVFWWLSTWLGQFEVSFVGTERLSRPGPCLIVANHPTVLDATLFVAVAPQLDHLAELSWARNPMLVRAIAAGGYLVNDDPRRVIDEAVRRLAAGRHLVIFPEGTRSPLGALHPFHRGAARIALASGCDLLPVVVRCEPSFGKKGQPWYDVPNEPPRMSLTVGAPISPREFVNSSDSAGVAARKVTRMLEEHFQRELRYLPQSVAAAQ